MKALTLTQPWASLVAIGAKRIETRSWAPPRSVAGQRIAIHAAKAWTEDNRWLATTEPYKGALRDGYTRGLIERPHILELPRGCVIAIATVAVVYPTAALGAAPRELEDLLADPLFPHERAFGGYAPGRWAWVLRDVWAVEPIPARGALGVWDWQPPDWLTYVDTAVRLAARAAPNAAMAVSENATPREERP